MRVARARELPLRTCVACRTTRPKRELVRIVRAPGGEVMIDTTGRAAGRGAYLCADGACWPQALKKSAIERALSVPLPAEIRHRLEAGTTGALAGGGPHGS